MTPETSEYRGGVSLIARVKLGKSTAERERDWWSAGPSRLNRAHTTTTSLATNIDIYILLFGVGK